MRRLKVQHTKIRSGDNQGKWRWRVVDLENESEVVMQGMGVHDSRDESRGEVSEVGEFLAAVLGERQMLALVGEG